MPHEDPADTTAGRGVDYDATHLFPAGMKAPSVLVSIMDEMYSVKAEPRENWIWFAFQGFMRLAERFRSDGFVPRSFAAVGSGNGLDAIGAAYAFPTLQRIVVTDVDEAIVASAVANVRSNVPVHVEVIGLTGDVCRPIEALPFKIDVVYANLPNIPSDHADAIDHGTFFRTDAGDGDQELDRHLLTLQAKFLRSVPPVLAERGLAAIMIGGRFPTRILDHLGVEAGFDIQEVLADFKVQTEAGNVTSGYAAAETGGLTFDFYGFDAAERIASAHAGAAGGELKRLLAPCRLTAGQAAREVALGRPVGHVVHMLAATPRR